MARLNRQSMPSLVWKNKNKMGMTIMVIPKNFKQYCNCKIIGNYTLNFPISSLTLFVALFSSFAEDAT